ncbi:hypothetical protein BG011_001129 [Mortierella polycephala]|uniref:Uncharacterized protein n=1 Tax=Mortierella polycephala TaxID=41804 RepID=A0A9P6Q7Y2_9FUNG|nr:hypothetical protein BG011_001129 [Mortierella polycephala]
MGNYISYTKNEVIYSVGLIAVWLLIRPFFVRMSEQAQAKDKARLEAEADAFDAMRQNTNQSETGDSSTNRASRKKLD